MNFKGKSAIITGAASGIGRATARKLAGEGVKLVIVDFNEEMLNETLELVKKDGAEAYAVVADVSDVDDVVNYVKVTKDKFGTIDLFYNNAGVLQAPAFLHEGKVEDFDKIVSVNLRGAFLGMKYVLTEMVKQQSGVVVNCGSHASIRAEPMLGMYAASKHAVAGLTVSAAAEYGSQGIRVNAVCPGGVKTPMTEGMPESDDLSGFGPMHRMAEAEEVADSVIYLLSDKASYVNGVLLPVDGGLAV